MSKTKSVTCKENDEKKRKPNGRSPSDKSLSLPLLYNEPEGEGKRMPLKAYLQTFVTPGPFEKAKNEQPNRKKANLGVVLGVYLPTIQHIFGVLMFLRLFWIVGSMGIMEAFFMAFICCLCTFLTCISISALATNGKVESGGAYFMISRSLGPGLGTAIGTLFYLANAVASAMYIVGGVEIFLMYLVPSATIPFGLDLLEADSLHKQEAISQIHLETEVFGRMTHNFRIYGTILLLIISLIVACGVRFVQLFAPLSLAGVILSILAIYAGAIAKTVTDPPDDLNICVNQIDNGSSINYVPLLLATGFSGATFQQNAYSNYMKEDEAAPGVKAEQNRDVFQDTETSFFILLAIYFPSVTGIFTGSNMSGDLKDPQKAIPFGTLLAQLTTSFVYLSFVFIFGSSIDGLLLRDKYGRSLGNRMVVANLGWPHEYVVLIGCFTSTFGAAIQCVCSAPRLLQSIARDEVIPFLRPFSKTTRCHNEPIFGLILSSGIAMCFLMIGTLDRVAPVVDFFFLMCYAVVNLVCVFYSFLGVPNWRPRYRFYSVWASILGALLCFFIMFATHWYFGLAVLALTAVIYIYVAWKGNKREWGDGFRGLYLTLAQFFLLKLEDKEFHAKNWRPQLLILVKESMAEEKRRKLLEFAEQLKGGRGLTIFTMLVKGDSLIAEDRQKAKEAKTNLQVEMKQLEVDGFTKTVLYKEEQMAGNVDTLVQSSGIGGLKPNTIMVGWPGSWKAVAAEEKKNVEYWDFLDKIHRGVALDTCLLIVRGLKNFPSSTTKLSGFIDIWWIMHEGFILTRHRTWAQCSMRIFAVAYDSDNTIEIQRGLEQWLYQLRIDAEVNVVEFQKQHIHAYKHVLTLMKQEREKLLKELGLQSGRQGAMFPYDVMQTSNAQQKDKDKGIKLERKSPSSSSSSKRKSRSSSKRRRNNKNKTEKISYSEEVLRNPEILKKFKAALALALARTGMINLLKRWQDQTQSH